MENGVFKRPIAQLALTTADWALTENANKILNGRQLGFELLGEGKFKVKMGDGVSKWSELPYGISGNLSDMVGDTDHRTVTDAQINLWTGKTDMAEVQSYVAGKIATVYKSKGSVDKFADLPTEGMANGDVYNVVQPYVDPVSGKKYNAGTNWAWIEADGDTPARWDSLGGSFDLSAYITSAGLEDILDTLAEDGRSVYDELTEETTVYKMPTVGQMAGWDGKAEISDIPTSSADLEDANDIMRYSEIKIIDGGVV